MRTQWIVSRFCVLIVFAAIQHQFRFRLIINKWIIVVWTTNPRANSAHDKSAITIPYPIKSPPGGVKGVDLFRSWDFVLSKLYQPTHTTHICQQTSGQFCLSPGNTTIGTEHQIMFAQLSALCIAQYINISSFAKLFNLRIPYRFYLRPLRYTRKHIQYIYLYIWELWVYIFIREFRVQLKIAWQSKHLMCLYR